jgi:hypothetical protein
MSPPNYQKLSMSLIMTKIPLIIIIVIIIITKKKKKKEGERK